MIITGILRCRFDNQFKSGKIIKSFHCWKNYRFLIIVVFLIIDFSGKIFVLYSYFTEKDLGDGDGSYLEQSTYSKGWILFNTIFDSYGFMQLIWLLWKMRFIKRAIEKLKNSDDFPGEYFEDSVSVCDKKEVNQQKEKEKKQKQKEKEKQKIFDEIAEKLKNFENPGCKKNFRCNKKINNSRIVENENSAEVYSDSEIQYKKMCQFMHPIDFLACRKKTNEPIVKIILA